MTTRPMRAGERAGVDYVFVSGEAFDAAVRGDELLEHATVFDHRYGTPRAPVDEALVRGRDVLFDIDWQGTQQLREKARDDLVSVFVLPPSHGELERRLKARAQDSDDVVAARMAKASGEISHWAEYDYVIVNDDLDRALANIAAILAAERLRRPRQIGLSGFVRGLQEG
jgi:guanylate kinase